MVLDTQFLDWFNASITVENMQGSSSGGYGGRGFSANGPQTTLARLEQYIKNIKSRDGNDVLTKGRLFVSPVTATTSAAAVTVRVNDRITIPAGYILGTTTQPRILDVEQHNDENGSPMFFEVLV